MEKIKVYADEFFTRTDKPTIHLYKDHGSSFGEYFCRFAYSVKRKDRAGYGSTPCEAYLDWEKKNAKA